jgi:hypothetical protein
MSNDPCASTGLPGGRQPVISVVGSALVPPLTEVGPLQLRILLLPSVVVISDIVRAPAANAYRQVPCYEATADGSIITDCVVSPPPG